MKQTSNKNRKEILKTLSKEVQMIGQIQQKTDVSRPTCERHLHILLGEGIIERIKIGGGKYNNYYGWRLKK